MKNIVKCIILIFFQITAILNAQSNGKITGKILDKSSRQPVSGASIEIVGTKIGAASDSSGNYVIYHVKPGLYKLSIYIDGYGTIVSDELTVKDGQTATKNIILELNNLDLIKKRRSNSKCGIR